MLARALGLKSCTAISIPKQRKFTVTNKSGVIFEWDPEIFKAINLPDNHSIKLCDPIELCKYRPEVSVSCSVSDTNERIYTSKLSINDGHDIFSESIYTGISTMLSAVYDGYNLNNSDLSLCINAKLGFDTDRARGNAYAAVLGLYRFITELGIPTDNSSVSITSDEPSLSFSLKAFRHGTIADFSSEFSKESLAEMLYNDNGLPDFDKIRELLSGN